jgi:hypothetical protein
MVAHRIADPLILRLIGKWLNAGFMVEESLRERKKDRHKAGRSARSYPISTCISLLISGSRRRSDRRVSRKGKFTVNVRTMKKRLRRGLKAIAEWGQEKQQTLNAKLRGHYQYYGLPTNSRSIWKFYRGVCRIWRKWLNRRTRGKRLTWEKYTELLDRHPLLLPWITRSWNCAGSGT